MKILFIIPGDINLPTGGYRYDREILRWWEQNGIVHELVSLPGSYPFPNEADIHKAVASVTEMTGDVAVVDGLLGGAAPTFLAELAKKMAIVALIHHPLCLENGLSKEEAAKLEASERQGLADVSGIITTSPATTETVRSLFKYDPARVHTVLPGIERSKIATGSNADTLNLLCVGSIIERKGHRTLLQALARLKHLGWYLDCIGMADADSPLFQELQKLVTDLELEDRIRFHGAVDVPVLDEHYASADLFVLPSLYEGYGMAYAEAIVRGIPVIGTTAGAIPDTVPTGCGILVEPENADELAKALEQMIGDTRLRETAKKACLSAEPNFPTWEHSAYRFAQILKEIA